MRRRITKFIKIVSIILIFSAALNLSGCSLITDGKQKSRNIEMVDPNSLLFSLPTISNDLPGITPTNFIGANFIEMHEDDWRQIEFISVDQKEKIYKEITSIQNIYDRESVEVKPGLAFKDTHVRELIPRPITTPFHFDKLSNSLGNNFKRGYLKIIGYQGVVKNGFYFEADGIKYYGQTKDGEVIILGIYSADSKNDLINSIDNVATLLNSENLLLVDWVKRLIINNEQELDKYFGREQTMN